MDEPVFNESESPYEVAHEQRVAKLAEWLQSAIEQGCTLTELNEAVALLNASASSEPIVDERAASSTEREPDPVQGLIDEYNDIVATPDLDHEHLSRWLKQLSTTRRAELVTDAGAMRDIFQDTYKLLEPSSEGSFVLVDDKFLFFNPLKRITVTTRSMAGKFFELEPGSALEHGAQIVSIERPAVVRKTSEGYFVEQKGVVYIRPLH